MHAKYEGQLPDGWQSGEPVTKYWNGDYIHLYRVVRPCATCGTEISLDVTRKALEGTKKNAGLLLRNCPKCRAERKAGGPGSRGGKSRPVAGDAPATAQTAVAPSVTEELERLRSANATMKEELTGLYAQLKELLAERTPAPAVPKPVYKLPPEPLTMAESTKALRANNGVKMPWE
jgi:hypothetical protein